MTELPDYWLKEYDLSKLRAYIPEELPPLPTPPNDQFLNTIQIRDDGSPLMELPSDITARHVYAELDSKIMPKRMLIRKPLIARLKRADSALPQGFNLVLLDTWRSQAAQEEIHRLYTQKIPNLSSNYVADPFNPQVPAPHTTGAAVDLTISYQGRLLPLGSDFDEFDSTSHFLHFEDTPISSAHDTAARDLRRLLSHCMISQGFAPIATEWWHFSYGDQRWALFHNIEEAQYGQCSC